MTSTQKSMNSEALEPRSRWAHRNGNEYTVLVLTNTESTRPEYPPRVIYQGDNGNVWDKTVEDFLAKMTLVAPASDDTRVQADSVTEALTLLDFGLSFALCNMDHYGTRRDVKKAQAHLTRLRELLAAESFEELYNAVIDEREALQSELVKARDFLCMSLRHIKNPTLEREIEAYLATHQSAPTAKAICCGSCPGGCVIAAKANDEPV